MSTTGPATGRRSRARTGEVRTGRARSSQDEPGRTAARGNAGASGHGHPPAKGHDPGEAVALDELPRPSRDKFEIFVHPREDTHAGKIWHPFSKRERPLEGLDGERIVEFIRECMPAAPEPRGGRPETAAQPIIREGVVKELELRQGERCDSAGRVALRPEEPFSVTVRIALAAPPGERIPFNVEDYTVRLVARRPDAPGAGKEGMAVGRLAPGQSEYESSIDMPPLAAGEYVLDAYTRVPWAAIAEYDRTLLQVG